MEFLDIVDLDDEVIGKAEKNRVYKESLMHRIVHVLIFNDDGEMALQLRSSKCSYCPLHWATSVGGHVQSGESYEEAALREYDEELGTSSNLDSFTKDFYHDKRPLSKFLGTFRTINNGPFDLDQDVVQKVIFASVAEIKKMIEQGEKFHPELLFLLDKYYF